MTLSADGALAGQNAWDGVDRRAAVRPAITAERLDAAQWDRAVADFDGIVQEQLQAYVNARWPSTPCEAMLFKSGDAPVGGALVMIQRLPLGLGAIAVCKWGPILKDAAAPDAAAVYAAMVDALVAEYGVKRRMMLSIMPRASTGIGNREFEHLTARRFSPGPAIRYPDRYIVKLGLADDARRKSLHQKWRYHVNKADKAGLLFERAGVERLGEFDVLYGAMIDRKQFPDHSAYETIAALYASPVESLRPELFFVRHAESGEVVAGAVIFKAGDTAVYLFGATNDRALPMRAGYFLHWHIIRWLRDNTKAQWYDLGGTEGFQGLHQFKKGMVGDAGVIVPMPPVANFAAYPLPKLLGTAAYAAREALQEAKRSLSAMRHRTPSKPAAEAE